VIPNLSKAFKTKALPFDTADAKRSRESGVAVSHSKVGTGMFLCSCLVIFGMLLAACGGGSTSTQPSSSTGAKSTVLTVNTSITGTYTRTFSPFGTNPNPGARGLVYETLLYFNAINGNVTPWLASSYKFSDDAKSLTFTLRQGVKWSDGQAFSSDDVLFTLNMIKQYPAADANGLWTYIDSVTAPDANTVTLTLKQPYTPIVWRVGGQTYIVSKHLWSSVGDPTKYADANPVGTGPYLVNQFSPQLVDYKKNPNYWQPGKPAVTEVKYPAFNSNTNSELLMDQGQFDWSGIFTPNIEKTFVSRDPAHYHYWFPSAAPVMLYLNLTKAPFNQLPVRQAISSALDRQKMYQVAESGYEPVASPTGLVLPNNSAYLDPQYSNTTFTQDTAKAKQLIQSATGVSGKTFNLNVVTGWTDWVTICQIVAANLKDLGMNVTVNPISYDSYVADLQNGNFDMAISWTNPGPTPYYLFDTLLNSKYTAAVGQKANSNWQRWKDAETDQLLNQYATSTDQTKQKQAIYGLEKIMVDSLPSIPLVYGATWYEYTTTHFTGWPDKDNPYATPSPYTYPDAEVVILNLKPV